MKYKIICDSCTDLQPEEKQNSHIQMIPLILSLGEKEYIDDETFNQAQFIKDMAAHEASPKSACPSSGTYLDAIINSDAEYVFIVTLSKELSGSYQSAVIAKDMYYEDHGSSTKKILVINSKTASVGQALICKKLIDLCGQEKSFEAVSDEIIAYTNEMKTFFVLESLENLRKNGRLSKIQAIIASALNIKPVMGSDNGHIIKLAQVRGFKKALDKMTELIDDSITDQPKKTIGIAHCNNIAGAELVRELLTRLCRFADIYITETGGVATLYASDGGIIVCG